MNLDKIARGRSTRICENSLKILPREADNEVGNWVELTKALLHLAVCNYVSRRITVPVTNFWAAGQFALCPAQYQHNDELSVTYVGHWNAMIPWLQANVTQKLYWHLANSLLSGVDINWRIDNAGNLENRVPRSRLRENSTSCAELIFLHLPVFQ
jgi:hypothetical protein